MKKINWNYPTSIWVGENRIKDLSLACKNLNIKKPLLVTDKGLGQSAIVKDALSNLKSNNLSPEIFYDVNGPTIPNYRKMNPMSKLMSQSHDISYFSLIVN